MNGWNAAVADPFGGIVIGRDWSSCPSISRDTITSLACSPPRRVNRAVGVTLSRPETASRARATSATWMLSEVSSPSWTAVTLEPAGSWMPSSPVHALRWKSVSKKTSPLGSSDSSRIVCETFRAGPNRVAEELIWTVSRARVSCERSAVERVTTRAPCPNITRLARSRGPSSLKILRASSSARSNWSAISMLYDWSIRTTTSCGPDAAPTPDVSRSKNGRANATATSASAAARSDSRSQ